MHRDGSDVLSEQSRSQKKTLCPQGMSLGPRCLVGWLDATHVYSQGQRQPTEGRLRSTPARRGAHAVHALLVGLLYMKADGAAETLGGERGLSIGRWASAFHEVVRKPLS